jgi:hypothetical protein
MRSGAYRTPYLFTSLGATAPGTPGTTLRAWCGLLPDDTAVAFVGTTTKLYQYDGATTFTDRSIAGGYTNTATDWSFGQYGNITIATNRVDAVQVRDSSGSSAFANLAGSPPKARIAVTQADQVLLFDLNDGAEKPDAFATSAPGDHTDWSGAGATTATRIRHRPGKITAAIAFRDYVLVFKRSSVYRLTYTGSSTFKWRVELIAVGRGAWGKHDVVNCGDIIVLSGPGGVWTFDGASFRGITDYYGELTTAKGSYFQPIDQNVVFVVGSGVDAEIYNVVSDSWGRSNFHRTTDGSSVVTGLSFRPMTGDPAALRTFVGLTTYSRDATMLLNLSNATPVYRDAATLWGGGTFAASASLTTGVDGLGGRTVTAFSELMFDWSTSIEASNIAPVAGEMLANIFTLTSKDSSDTLVASPSSAGDQRRFDFQVSSPYMRATVNIDADEGYVEINDYTVNMQSAGQL